MPARPSPALGSIYVFPFQSTFVRRETHSVPQRDIKRPRQPLIRLAADMASPTVRSTIAGATPQEPSARVGAGHGGQ
jgi:hypothetical protein